MTATILIGDALAVLRTLPADHFHCAVTSPPYWSLRNYGTNPQVWGGSDPSCTHAWGGDALHVKGGAGQNKGLANGDEYREARDTVAQTVNRGAYCDRCDAWRGELGSEPDPSLYVANLISVFREVRRVLHSSGTLWLNLSGSYAGSGKGPGGKKQQTNKGSGTGTPTTRSHFQDAERRQGFTGSSGVRMGSVHGEQGHTSGVTPPIGYKAKDLILIPFMVAEALRQDGWYLRSVIVWAKKAPMPESVTDRPTSAHEYIFLLSKRANYFYDAEAVREDNAEGAVERFGKNPAISIANRKYDGMDGQSLAAAGTRMPEWQANGRNMRNVWHLGPEPYPDAHFATFVTEIPRRAILAGTSEKGCCPACRAPWTRVVERDERIRPHRGGKYTETGANGTNRVAGGAYMAVRPSDQTLGWQPGCRCDAGAVPCAVLDPFLGSGTTLLVASRLGRSGVGIELSSDYAAMAEKRIQSDAPMFAEVEPVTETAPHGLFDAEAAS